MGSWYDDNLKRTVGGAHTYFWTKYLVGGVPLYDIFCCLFEWSKNIWLFVAEMSLLG